MKRALLAGITAALLTMGLLTHLPADAQEPPPNEGVCEGTQVDAGGTEETIEITAPEGFLISQVCVKAGSIIQGDGPEITTYDPPVASVTLEHSSGKGISHYVITYVPITTTSTSTTSTTAPTTTSSTTSTSTTSTSTTSTTAPTTSTTIPTPTLFAFGAAGTECQAGVPYIVITFANTFPELAGEVGVLQAFAIADDSFVGEVEVVYEPGTTVEILYPGSSVDEDGNVTDVPGWILVDGFWIPDASDEYLRDGLLLEYSVGEEVATAEVTYPPETSLCANPENPPVTTDTTVPGGETTTTANSPFTPTGSPGVPPGTDLPRTGVEPLLPVGIGIALVGGGLVAMDLRQRRVKKAKHLLR